VVVEEGQATEKWRTPAQPGGVGESSENIDLHKCVFDRKFLLNIASKLSGFRVKILMYFA
jgi:hypothetical protein